MGTVGTIARRSFLIGSAAIAGGVAFGVYAVKKPHANPLDATLAEGEASFNPWVKVSRDKITLITNHADIGQGSAHMQATLIAEEMDLDPGQFETDFGEPAPAYYNKAFASEAGDALSRVTPLSAAAAEAVLGSVLKLVGLQGTGGSTSVPDSYDKLRRAGAVARETLKLAAAEQTGVPVDQIKTASGKVILPDGREIAYTDLAETAAGLPPVQEVTLRDPSQWRLAGKPMQRLDIVAKSTGTQAYGIDLAVNGMVHASVRMSPRRSALESYDSAAAEAMPGVTRIVPITNGLAVIARNTWTAMQAANAIDCTWAPAPYPAEQDGHWQALANGFTQDRMEAEWRNDGDAVAATAQGAVEAEFRAPYVAHQPLEPLNAIVRVDDAGVEVWTGHQMPAFVQQNVAAVTGHDPAQVTFHNQYSGGSFGHRLEFEHLKAATEIANQMRGTPVKLTLSREEDFATDFPRHIALARARGKVEGGRIAALDFDVAAPPIIASQGARAGLPPAGPDSQLGAGIWNAPYAVENFRMRGFAVPEVAPVSSWRSVGASAAGFFLESFVDELAIGAGLDPMQARLDLMGDHPVARQVLETAAKASGWGRDLGPNTGLGVALVESFGVPVAEVVEVTATPRGVKINKVWVVSDSGIVLDPVNIENHIQGAVIWGLGHAMNSEITYADGMAEQTNYHAAEGMRIYQTPEIEVITLQNAPAIRGIGEPPVPPAAPALANAIFAATGTRLREMPFHKFVDFV